MARGRKARRVHRAQPEPLVPILKGKKWSCSFDYPHSTKKSNDDAICQCCNCCGECRNSSSTKAPYDSTRGEFSSRSCGFREKDFSKRGASFAHSESPIAVRMERNHSSSFEKVCDIRHFSPEEITIKISEDDSGAVVQVEGFHNKDPQRRAQCCFIQKFPLPHRVQPDDITATIEGSSGLLVIRAVNRYTPSGDPEYPIRRFHTGCPANNVNSDGFRDDSFIYGGRNGYQPREQLLDGCCCDSYSNRARVDGTRRAHLGEPRQFHRNCSNAVSRLYRNVNMNYASDEDPWHSYSDFPLHELHPNRPEYDNRYQTFGSRNVCYDDENTGDIILSFHTGRK